MNDSFTRLLERWTPAEEIPAKAVEWLPVALAHAEAAVQPCGRKALVVLLDRLWTICPMPTTEALRVWVETLEKYPEDLVKAAIDRVIETRTWERDPPMPAHVVSHLREDMAARTMKRNRLKVMRDKAEMAAKAAQPTGRRYSEMTPEEQAAFDAKMESLTASIGTATAMPGVRKGADGRGSRREPLDMSDAEIAAAKARIAEQARQAEERS